MIPFAMKSTVDGPVVLIILDAFRWDYVNESRTPELVDLARHGLYVRRLRTTPGFTQRTAIFCGCWPDSSGKFSMYAFRRRGPRRYAFLRLVPPKLLERVDSSELASRIVRRALRDLARVLDRRGTYFPPSEIPVSVLPYLDVTEDRRPIFSRGALAPCESLFDVLRENRRPIIFLMHPVAQGDDDWVYRQLVAPERKWPERVFVAAQFSSSDAVIHHAGVGSEEAERVVRRISRWVGKVKEALDRRFDDYALVLIGDHGMVNVDSAVDIEGKIQNYASTLGCRVAKDYFYMLNSTIAHLWSFSARGEKLLEKVQSDSDFQRYGFFVDIEMRKRLRIPSNVAEYGNLLWAAKEGILIFPDFFHRKAKCRAMHGYLHGGPGGNGMLIVYRPGRSTCTDLEEAALVDVCPTTATLLGVRVPRNSEGRDLWDF